MALSNRWNNENALCPFCLRVFGEWREDGCHLTHARIVLIFVVTLRCGYEDCGKIFTYRPRKTPVCPDQAQSQTQSASAPEPRPAVARGAIAMEG